MRFLLAPRLGQQASFATSLDLSEENVKVRLHRGRAMLRSWLVARVGAQAKNAFSFMGVRCDRVLHGVFQRLADLSPDRLSA
jgi:RNA polymerase sigma-70 factor (ECF subfamily)